MSKERVHGPYKHGKKWRVVEVGEAGNRSTISFEDLGEAQEYVAAARRVACGRTVGEAVTEYLDHLRALPGKGGRMRRDSTLKLERWRLVAFLRLPGEDGPLGLLTPSRMKRLVKERTLEVKFDTLHGEANAVARFTKWAREQKLLLQDPMAGVQVVGEHAVGKPQLRVAEAQRFLRFCLQDDLAGLPCAMALMMGMRASEITGLVVRDVDDGATIVWIPKAKTKRGIRRLAVPAVLVPRLARLVAGRAGDELVFGKVDRHWLSYHVQRIADAAGVPRVTPHGLRGTFATLAVEAVGTQAAAAALGHLPGVTEGHYAQAGAVQSFQAKQVEQQLGGHDAEAVHDHGGGGPRGGDMGGAPELEAGENRSGRVRSVLRPGPDGERQGDDGLPGSVGRMTSVLVTDPDESFPTSAPRDNSQLN